MILFVVMEENNKLPKSALTLYVKLYCRKGENIHSKDKMLKLKATASWLSLTEHEKQKFLNKLRELQNSYKKTFANYLKNAELFMKKKHPKPIRHITQTLESTIQHNSGIEEMHCQPNIRLPNECMEADYENQLNLNESHNIIYPKLPEPMPPTIKNAKELFEIIQKNKRQHNSNWNTLTVREKKRYQNALRSLKKEYIKRYREYLDCLSPKELFYHYQNNLTQ